MKKNKIIEWEIYETAIYFNSLFSKPDQTELSNFQPYTVYNLRFRYLHGLLDMFLSKFTVQVYAKFLDRSISATQSVTRNSEGHMEGAQPIKCMLFILIFNNMYHTNHVHLKKL